MASKVAEAIAKREAAKQPKKSEPTVDELKDELRSRDLPVSGTRQELLDRLVEADKA